MGIYHLVYTVEYYLLEYHNINYLPDYLKDCYPYDILLKYDYHLVNKPPYHAIVYIPVPCEESCPVKAISKDEHGIEPVSYTHLDVYKRQTYHSPQHSQKQRRNHNSLRHIDTSSFQLSLR